MPTNSVTENARSLPRRPAKVPLTDSTSVPMAMMTLPRASRLGSRTVRVADPSAGGRPRRLSDDEVQAKEAESAEQRRREASRAVLDATRDSMGEGA